MSENRDPAIKLFGKTIPLHLPAESLLKNFLSSDREDDIIRDEGKDTQKNEDSNETTKQVQDPSVSKENSPPAKPENIDLSPAENDDKTTDSPTSEEQSDNTNSQKEKMLKKPDKILSCPRCNSMDTKFCYYNNYNVNQPRHFCKNCQRYWTAGGTMRNVPVGAGRRKNKNSSALYRQISISDPAFQAIRADIADSRPYPQKPNGTVLSFGSDVPLCESMASVLNLAERGLRNGNRNGLHSVEDKKVQSSSCSAEKSSDSLSLASCMNPNAKVVVEENNSPTSSWPYVWPPSNFQFPFYPAPAYWTCAVPSGVWSGPWFSAVASSPTNGMGPNSPTLGKHSREGENGNAEKESGRKESNGEGRIWVPKTLRINDPQEAAKSSIWKMIGGKNEMSSGGFDPFGTKVGMRNNVSQASRVMRANPAALARSVSFKESS